MIFYNPYWSDKLKISTLQRWILVHCILYYVMDANVVSDKAYDDGSKQLVQMQKQNRDAAMQSDYWYVFNNFDGATGFDLYDRLNEKDKVYLTHIASLVLNDHKISRKGKGGK